MSNSGKQANNCELRISILKLPWETHSENAFWNSCGNKRHANKKELRLPIENNHIYNNFGQINWASFSPKLNLDYIWTISFSGQKKLHYLVYQFYYWLLIKCIKMPAMPKRQQLKNNTSVKTKVRGLKCQRLNEHDNKKENGLDDNEDEIKNAQYVPFFFIFSPLFP